MENRLTIFVTKTRNGFSAHFAGDQFANEKEQHFGTGSSAANAIGQLIVNHGTMLSVVRIIEGQEQK